MRMRNFIRYSLILNLVIFSIAILAEDQPPEATGVLCETFLELSEVTTNTLIIDLSQLPSAGENMGIGNTVYSTLKDYIDTLKAFIDSLDRNDRRQMLFLAQGYVKQYQTKFDQMAKELAEKTDLGDTDHIQAVYLNRIIGDHSKHITELCSKFGKKLLAVIVNQISGDSTVRIYVDESMPIELVLIMLLGNDARRTNIVYYLNEFFDKQMSATRTTTSVEAPQYELFFSTAATYGDHDTSVGEGKIVEFVLDIALVGDQTHHSLLTLSTQPLQTETTQGTKTPANISADLLKLANSKNEYRSKIVEQMAKSLLALLKEIP